MVELSLLLKLNYLTWITSTLNRADRYNLIWNVWIFHLYFLFFDLIWWDCYFLYSEPLAINCLNCLEDILQSQQYSRHNLQIETWARERPREAGRREPPGMLEDQLTLTAYWLTVYNTMLPSKWPHGSPHPPPPHTQAATPTSTHRNTNIISQTSSSASTLSR